MDSTRFMCEAEPLLTPLYRIAYCILRSQADAEDAVQQGLLRAFETRARIREGSFRPYVTRIVINESRNIQRHRMRVSPMAEPWQDSPFLPPDPFVMDAVHTLPEKLRIPFILKYMEHYTEKEVADAMRLPASTIKSRLARARDSLRQELREEVYI